MKNKFKLIQAGFFTALILSTNMAWAACPFVSDPNNVSIDRGVTIDSVTFASTYEDGKNMIVRGIIVSGGVANVDFMFSSGANPPLETVLSCLQNARTAMSTLQPDNSIILKMGFWGKIKYLGTSGGVCKYEITESPSLQCPLLRQ